MTRSVSQLQGRAEQLSEIGGMLDRGHVRGQVLLLLGEPGIGKSALLEAAAVEARERKLTVLSAGGVEAEAHFPFAGLYQLLAPVLDQVASLAPEEASALKSAFGMADGPQPDLFLIANAVVSLLRAVAGSGPLAVLVDDAQWLDAPTQECLTYVARHVDAIPAALLATVRVQCDGARPGILAAGLPELRITALGDEAAAAILEKSAAALPVAERKRIQDEAMGNPLALMELPAVWRSEGMGDAAPTLSARLERDFGGRVSSLPEVTRDLLIVAAVNETTDFAEVRTAASALAGRAITATDLQPALAAGLLTSVENPLRFRHPLVRSGILQAERVTRRQAAHAALAEVLADEPFRRAWHRAQAIVGPDDEVAEELEATVEESLRRGAVMSAISSLERAAHLTSSSALRGHRLLRAAEHAFGLGRADLVDRLVKEAATTSLSELDWARMQWLREIFSDGVPGDATRVLELCDVAVRSDAAGDTDLALNLLLGAALRCWWADTGPVARAHVAEVATRVSDLDNPRTVAILAVAEPVLCAAEVTAALEHMPVGSVEDADVLRLLGIAAHAIGDEARSDEYLLACESKLRTQKKLGLLAQALSMHVIVALEIGDWDRANAAAAEALRLSEETGQPIWTTGTLVCEAIAHGLQGDPERALELAAQSELEANRQRLNDLLSCVQLARGLAYLTLGQDEDAYTELRRAFEPTDPSYHQRERFGALMFLAEAARLTGRRVDAAEVVEELRGVAVLTPTPILHHHLAYARAVLAEDAAAEALYLTALAADLDHWPWIKARLELAYGTWLVRQGRIEQGRTMLSDALGMLEMIGAGHWAARARAELDPDGGAVAGRR